MIIAELKLAHGQKGSLSMRRQREREVCECASNHLSGHLGHLNIKFTTRFCEKAQVNTTSVIKKARSNIFRWYSNTNYVQPSFPSNEKKGNHRPLLFLLLLT